MSNEAPEVQIVVCTMLGIHVHCKLSCLHADQHFFMASDDTQLVCRAWCTLSRACCCPAISLHPRIGLRSGLVSDRQRMARHNLAATAVQDCTAF